MLKLGHAGYEFLTLADSFLDWGVNAEYLANYSYIYGQLESPPKRSLQTFNSILKKKGAILLPTNESVSVAPPETFYRSFLVHLGEASDEYLQKSIKPEQFPGIVVSCLVRKEKDGIVDLINHVKKGGNIIIVTPNHLLGNLKDKAYIIYNQLISQLNIDLSSSNNQCMSKFMPFKDGGKVFIIDGNFISDWGTSNDQYEKVINPMTDDFLKFNIPVASLSLINPYMVIPLNSSVYAECILTYWGPDGSEIEVNIDVDSDIEPESPTVIKFKNLSYGARRTVGFWFKPRVVGKFKRAICFKVMDKFAQEVIVDLEVFSGYKDTISENSVVKKVLLEQLKKIMEKSYDIQLDNLVELLEIDPRTAIIKARYIAEKISKKICIHNKININGMNFAGMCRLISDKNLLSKKGIGYLNTVRIIGNIAAHAEDDVIIEFKQEDGLIVGQAIVEIMGELIDNNIL